MSYVHLYIEDYLKKDKSVRNAFSSAKIREKHRIIMDNIENNFKNMLKYKGVGKDISEEEYLKLVKSFQEGELQTAINQMTEKISMDLPQLKKTKENTEELQKQLQEIIDKFKNIIQLGKFDKNIDDILKNLTIEEIKQAYFNNESNGRSAAMKAVREKFRDVIKLDNSFEVPVYGYSQQGVDIKKVTANIKGLESILQNFKSESYITGDFKSDCQLIKSFIASTNFILRKMIGNISEDKLVDEINKLIIKQIDFKKNNKKSGVAIVTGSNMVRGFSGKKYKSTPDVSVSEDYTALDGDGNVATFTVDMPAISLKRTSGKFEKKNLKINLKTNSNFERFFLEGSFKQYESHIANLLAANSERKVNKNKTVVTNKEDIVNSSAFWAMIKLSMLPNALIGNMTPDDFAYFLVVNNKIFNTMDIVREILGEDQNNIVGALNKNIILTEPEDTSKIGILEDKNKKLRRHKGETFQEVALRRSAAVFKEIQKQKISIQLMLKLTK